MMVLLFSLQDARTTDPCTMPSFLASVIGLANIICFHLSTRMGSIP